MKVAFVRHGPSLDRLLAVAADGQAAQLRYVVVWDALSNALPSLQADLDKKGCKITLLDYNTLIKPTAGPSEPSMVTSAAATVAGGELFNPPEPDDTACIIYTSGTTGGINCRLPALLDARERYNMRRGTCSQDLPSFILPSRLWHFNIITKYEIYTVYPYLKLTTCKTAPGCSMLRAGIPKGACIAHSAIVASINAQIKTAEHPAMRIDGLGYNQVRWC